jgi:uncharacterized protein (DUF983 family)
LQITHPDLLFVGAARLFAAIMQVERCSRAVPSRCAPEICAGLRKKPLGCDQCADGPDLLQCLLYKVPAKRIKTMTDAALQIDEDRPTGPAMRRGWQMRCPNCGQGRLLHSYLKVNSACGSCGLELHHQRADDGPAYLTILIAGHLMAPLLLYVYSKWEPDPLLMALGFTTVFVALSLYLLPRLKGVMVAIQWAKRMHGFGQVSPDV